MIKNISYWALLAGLSLLPSAVYAAVVIDGSGSAVTSTVSTTCSFSLAVGSGDDRAILVGVSYYDNYNNPHGVQSATYPGTTFTLVDKMLGSSHVHTELWKGVAPTSGTANLVVTMIASSKLSCGAVSFAGVDQVTPVSNTVKSTISAGVISGSVSSASGNMAMSVFGCDSCGLTSQNQTQKWGSVISSVGTGAGSVANGAPSVSFTWNADWSGPDLTFIATNINASVVALPPPPPAPDITPPTVSITAPVSGESVSGTSVNISANASDNVGVVGVQFKLDGTNLGAEDMTAPYAIVWDTTQSANGSHVITATARDAAGNSVTSTGATVTVSNIVAPPPPPTPTPTGNYPWLVWTSTIPVTPQSTTGATYYVDGTNGSDANNGLSLGASFKTIAKSTTVVKAGDTILIRKGLYREGIVSNGGFQGTAGKPITFGSYGDGEVILDGSTKVTGWTVYSGTIWKAPITFTPIAIVVNNIPLKQVRQAPYTTAPAENLGGVTSGNGKWYVGGGFIYADMGGVNPVSADIVIPNNVGDQQHVFFGGASYFILNGLTIRGSGSNGIWTYDQSSSVHASHIIVQNCNLEFNGKGGLTFNGGVDNQALYNYVHDNVLLNWPRGNGQNAESGGGWPGALGWSSVVRPVARGNIVSHNGGEGIISYGYGTVDGVITGSVLFEQNASYDNWSVNMYIDGQPNGVARSNILYDRAPDASEFIYIGAGYPWDGVLEKYRTCIGISDEYLSSPDHSAHNVNTLVENNIIAGCRIGFFDYGENALGHGLRNHRIVNNTIIMDAHPYTTTYSAGIKIGDNGAANNYGTLIANNIIHGNGNANGDINPVSFQRNPIILSESPLTLTGVTFSNNLYYTTATNPFSIGDVAKSLSSWKIFQNDTTSTLANPLLVDVTQFGVSSGATFGYASASLQAGSPAINAGVSTVSSYLTNDFALAVRPQGAGFDIGAFEYTGVVVVPPPTTYTLTATKVGSGTITSGGGSINCGTSCTTTVTNGTAVTLTATPASGYTFTGWSGACAGTGTCPLTISNQTNVVATFTIIPVVTPTPTPQPTPTPAPTPQPAPAPTPTPSGGGGGGGNVSTPTPTSSGGGGGGGSISVPPLLLSSQETTLKINTFTKITALGGLPPYTWNAPVGEVTVIPADMTSVFFKAPPTEGKAIVVVTDQQGTRKSLILTIVGRFTPSTLLATLNASTTGVTASISSTTKLTITKTLIKGMTDSQVKTLQLILNKKGYVIATSGPGSSGHERTYFGPATQQALQKFQCATLKVCSGTPTTTGYGGTGPRTRGVLNK